MPHIHIFLQELDRLYHAGDFDQYEQYWHKPVTMQNTFSQASRLPMQNSTTPEVNEYLMAPCIMS